MNCVSFHSELISRLGLAPKKTEYALPPSTTSVHASLLLFWAKFQVVVLMLCLYTMMTRGCHTANLKYPLPLLNPKVVSIKTVISLSILNLQSWNFFWGLIKTFYNEFRHFWDYRGYPLPGKTSQGAKHKNSHKSVNFKARDLKFFWEPIKTFRNKFWYFWSSRGWPFCRSFLGVLIDITAWEMVNFLLRLMIWV